jgi:hypothetical protein
MSTLRSKIDSDGRFASDRLIARKSVTNGFATGFRRFATGSAGDGGFVIADFGAEAAKGGAL